MRICFTALLLLSLPCYAAFAAEPAEQTLPDPEIEDPFGLGQRLALIDHLREELGIEPEGGLSYEELKRLYWKQVQPAKGESAAAAQPSAAAGGPAASEASELAAQRASVGGWRVAQREHEERVQQAFQARLAQAVKDNNELMEIAFWCLLNGMGSEAESLCGLVLEREPDNPAAARFLRRVGKQWIGIPLAAGLEERLPRLRTEAGRAERELRESVKAIRPSVVTLYVRDHTGTRGIGTAFCVGEGCFLTACHVLVSAEAVLVRTADNQVFAAEQLIAIDRERDIALFRVDIPAKICPPLAVCLDPPEMGERCFVFGAPEGLEQTLSEGIVSALRGFDGATPMIQISAPVSPGSSGSPVFNMRGEAIGIVSFLVDPSGMAQQLNFAAHMRSVGNLIDELKKRAAVQEQRERRERLRDEARQKLAEEQKAEQKAERKR